MPEDLRGGTALEDERGIPAGRVYNVQGNEAVERRSEGNRRRQSLPSWCAATEEEKIVVLFDSFRQKPTCVGERRAAVLQ